MSILYFFEIFTNVIFRKIDDKKYFVRSTICAHKSYGSTLEFNEVDVPKVVGHLRINPCN